LRRIKPSRSETQTAPRARCGDPPGRARAAQTFSLSPPLGYPIGLASRRKLVVTRLYHRRAACFERIISHVVAVGGWRRWSCTHGSPLYATTRQARAQYVAEVLQVLPGRVEDDFGGVAVNSEDADGNNGRLGSPRISPFLTARPALFPLRPCGRVVGIGRQAIGNLFGTLPTTSLCLSWFYCYVCERVCVGAGLGYAASLSAILFLAGLSAILFLAGSNQPSQRLEMHL